MACSFALKDKDQVEISKARTPRNKVSFVRNETPCTDSYSKGIEFGNSDISIRYFYIKISLLFNRYFHFLCSMVNMEINNTR